MTLNWQVIDEAYHYTGPLGAQVDQEGQWIFTLWAPTAEQVKLYLYDQGTDSAAVYSCDLKKSDQGQWQVQVGPQEAGQNELTGFYYNYGVVRQGQESLVLDPYAKSLAAWTYQEGEADAPRAALVDPENLGPDLENFGKIEGYSSPQDAVIYEVSVRDFTMDQSLNLDHRPGTFMAFIDRLDYLKDLGVTHIQLMPVMAQYKIDETQPAYSTMADLPANYNWGYDPLGYFAPTGFYSENPYDPQLRIKELKTLIAAIHDRGMGVTLDVVYNHTAALHIFEEIEPHYYHFVDEEDHSLTSFGGGRLASTHWMAHRLMLDSIEYWLREFKVDGFRFDMMGDHDAATLQAIADLAKSINPQSLIIGEGWRTYVGDQNLEKPLPASQDWMDQTGDVAVFSDELRNALKSGYPDEGQPAFLSGGPIDRKKLFDNLKGQPGNFRAQGPYNVVQYMEAHDNATVYDILALTLKLDPVADQDELLRRMRLGNLLVLTAQGVAFLHAGQEYGRSKQIRDDGFEGLQEPVVTQASGAETVFKKTYQLQKTDGQPQTYPYIVHDSYRAPDSVNHFDWVRLGEALPCLNHDYVQGLIDLRRSSPAFRLGQASLIDQAMILIDWGQSQDLVLAYRLQVTAGQTQPAEDYLVLINADDQARTFDLNLTPDFDLVNADLLADGSRARKVPLTTSEDYQVADDTLIIAPLTGLVFKNKK
ncbi:alpha-amylase family glycosyl hydrolase [Eremococcus coleocola]|uniref:alpha-amylase family glycosyl hydrolase n=1 Tax=Eremococcus coleocola TaxID=88132 RepID=UPI0003FE30EA|nr:alpha-amylase family glycosyl hydrolase [Eremococcus coleocola]